MDPSSAISFTHLLRERAEKTPGKVAVRYLADLGARIDEATYAQLDAHARAIAVELLQHCAPGDRAVLLYPPGIDYVYALLGCFYAGVIAVPAYPPEPRRLARTLPRLRALVANADAPVIMTDAMLFALAGGLAELAPELAAKKWLVPSLSAQSAPSDAWRMPALRHDQVAFLQYTSGSTGQPKGAVISHGNVLANCRQNRAATEATEESTWVSWLPLYHDLGLIAHLLVSLYSGATVVLLSPLDFLRQPALWLRAIDKYRGDISGAPNFAFDVCAAKIKPEEVSGLDLGCWRVAFNAAEPVRADTVERFARAFAPAKLRRESLYIAYGLAEATVLVSRTVFGSPVRVLSLDAAALEESRIVPATGTTPARNLVSAGVAVDQEVIVVGPSGSELAEGQVGELWIRGENVACGYWNNEEATAASFGAVTKAGRGPYLRSGDLGFYQDGELYVAGRIKDVIILRGKNHYPQDIEETVESSYPSIRRGCSAAFSVVVDDEERLVVVAEVDPKFVPKKDALPGMKSLGAEFAAVGEDGVLPFAPDSIIGNLRAAVSLNHGATVFGVALIAPRTIPKTSSGKIQRSSARKHYLDRALEPLAEHRDP